MSKAVDTAIASLHTALEHLRELEEKDYSAEVACDSIREVLDQLAKWCHKDYHLVGKEDMPVG